MSVLARYPVSWTIADNPRSVHIFLGSSKTERPDMSRVVMNGNLIVDLEVPRSIRGGGTSYFNVLSDHMSD